jgi:invasion protein IalB
MLGRETIRPPTDRTVMTPTLRPAPALRAAAFATVLATLSAAGLNAQTAPAAPETPAPGQPYLVAEHRDWQVICTRLQADGPEICEMYQLLTEASGQPIAEISIAALPDEGDIIAGATITTPLETFLPAGVGFRTAQDAETMRVEQFRVCTAVGCVVRMGLARDEIETLQRGSEAFVTIVPFVAIDQPVDIRVSLLGFTAALREVRQRTPAPPNAVVLPGAPPAVIDPSAPPPTPPAAAAAD